MRIKTVSIASVILVTLLSFNVLCAWGSENEMPPGCLESGFKQAGGEVVLNPGAADKQSLFLLHNVTDGALQVTHPVKNVGASAGWTSEINPGRWSAFAADSENFALSCMQFTDGKMKTLPCEKMLKVCELPNPKMPADLSGSFWVSEDKNEEGVLAEIKSRGISWGK